MSRDAVFTYIVLVFRTKFKRRVTNKDERITKMGRIMELYAERTSNQ